MSQCPNCKTTLGCGCQRRTASNGAQVCANCISAYEAKLKSTPPPNPALTVTFQPKK